MKNTLLSFVLLFSVFQLQSQIPDSLEVTLPWEQVTIESCDGYMGEGPTTTNFAVNVYRDNDQYIYNTNGDCIKRIKKWGILDWYGGIIYDVFQVGNVSEETQTNCENEIYLTYEELPMELRPEDLLLDLNPTHTYSFSFEDPNHNTISLYPTIDNVTEVSVYNHTTSSVCLSTVYVTQCEDDIVLDFPEKVEIVFAGETYIPLTLDLLGVSIEYPCEPYTTEIRLQGGTNILFASSVGKIITATVSIKLESGDRISKTIDIHSTGVKPDPISMYMEDVSFSAGETIELDVWSQEIPDLLAWQFQFVFENAEILEVEKTDLFDAVPYNVLDDEITLRTLWTPADGLPQDIPSNATWFTIKLVPSIDGTTTDILDLDIDPWNLIAVLGDDVIFQFEAEFIFNLAPRNILSSSATIASSDLYLYPNPATNIISIEGLPRSNSSVSIDIYDIEGRLQITHTVPRIERRVDLDISTLANGIYIIKTKLDGQPFTQKFVKI